MEGWTRSYFPRCLSLPTATRHGCTELHAKLVGGQVSQSSPDGRIVTAHFVRFRTGTNSDGRRASFRNASNPENPVEKSVDTGNYSTARGNRDGRDRIALFELCRECKDHSPLAAIAAADPLTPRAIGDRSRGRGRRQPELPSPPSTKCNRRIQHQRAQTLIPIQPTSISPMPVRPAMTQIAISTRDILARRPSPFCLDRRIALNLASSPMR
jgi:hypothetical protein